MARSDRRLVTLSSGRDRASPPCEGMPASVIPCHPGPMPSDRVVRYTFVLGMEHSGSTLLAFLLSAHPEVATVGAAFAVPRLLRRRWIEGGGSCSCGRPYRRCDFWADVLAGSAARGHGLTREGFLATGRRDRGAANRRLHAFAESVIDAAQARIFLDISKDPLQLDSLRRSGHFDLSVIDLHRDGRAVVAAWLRRNAELGFDRMIDRWLRREKRRDAVLRHIDGAVVHRVRHEDLATEPASVMAGVGAFIGLTTPIATTGFKTRTDHHVIGNPMRLDDVEEIRLDERWREELTPVALAAFEVRGGERNTANGYS